MKKLVILSVALSMISLANAAEANFMDKVKSTTKGRVEASAQIGALQGMAKEYVYDTDGSLLSRLDWKTKTTAILKGGVSFAPFSWAKVGVRGWSTFYEGNAHMDDYDWIYTTGPAPDHESHHGNTDLKYANEFDFYANFPFLNIKSFTFAPLIGYKQTRFSWAAYGGWGIYTGTFWQDPDDEPGISYSQKFKNPYTGLNINYKKGQHLEVNGDLRYSKWVKASDQDKHHQRSLHFKEYATDMDYYGFNVNLGYKFNNGIKFFGEFNFDHYEHEIADTWVRDNSTGTTQTSQDSAGIKNKYYSLMLGLAYKF